MSTVAQFRSTLDPDRPRRHPFRHRLIGLLAALAVVAGLAVTAVVTPAIVAPGSTSQAQAAVYQCGCPQSAYTMRTRWADLGYPRSAAWRQIGTNQWLYGGAVHQNREQQLPIGGNYREYDAQVYTSRGQARGAKRLVVNVDSLAAWYSPNHYTDFYRM
jgi:guanyl-specific ribonuclease Sa